MGNQGASNPNQDIMQEWIDSGKIGSISNIHVWTSRPIWPQGVHPPKPDPSLKPKKLNWDLWLGQQKKQIILLIYIHLTGEVGGSMVQELLEIWDVI